MNSRIWMGLAALGLLACSGVDSEGEVPTTFAEQVTLGQTAYGKHCANCHGDAGQGTTQGPAVVGLASGALPLDPPVGAMARTEKFTTLADVADFVVKTMPPGKAGTIDTETLLSVLAFDLKANGIELEEKLTLDLAKTLTIPRDQ